MLVRIIAPSGAINPKYIDDTISLLHHWGWQVSEGHYTRTSCGRFAATTDQRLQDLMDALSDPDIDVVLCARGGYGLQQIIDRLPDWEPKRHLPVIVGFSDITCLHQWCLRQHRPSLHAMMCKGLSECNEKQQIEELDRWRRAVEGGKPVYDLPAHPLNRSGKASGTFVGGNLSVLYGLQGTPFGLDTLLNTHAQNAESHYILFLEDIGERHYHIDRMMNNLRMSGVLGRIDGLVVGQMTDCPDDEGMQCTVYQTIARAVADYTYPVIFGFDAGHGTPNHSLCMGAVSQMETDGCMARLQFL